MKQLLKRYALFDLFLITLGLFGIVLNVYALIGILK